MPVMSGLRFLHQDDPAPYPDLDADKIISVEQVDIFVLDAGTQSGRPSVALKIDLPDGQTVVAQTTARLFCTHARAIMARYPDLFDGD